MTLSAVATRYAKALADVTTSAAGLQPDAALGELRAFETALAELERILQSLEDGTTSLDESLAHYERGVTLLRQCYGQLQSAEQKIQQLTGTDESGRPVLVPFEHTATATKAETAPPATKKKKKDSDPPF